MAISKYTQQIITLYDERMLANPTNFFRSFFEEKTSDALKVSYDAVRKTLRMADEVFENEVQDVQVGEHTNIEVDPFNYGLEAKLSNWTVFTRSIGVDPFTDASRSNAAKTIDRLMTTFMEIGEMLERRREYHAAQALINGVVTSSLGDSNDFKRKATHNITPTTNWNASGADIKGNLLAACQLSKQDGKKDPDVLILGEKSFDSLYSDDYFKEQLDQEHNLTTQRIFMRNAATAAILHGKITVGSYQLMVWTYPEFYQNATDVYVPYMPDNVAVILPQMPNFCMAYAGVPTLIPAGARDVPMLAQFGLTSVQGTVQARNVPQVYQDEKKDNVVARIRSRSIPLPIATDMTVKITTQ